MVLHNVLSFVAHKISCLSLLLTTSLCHLFYTRRFSLMFLPQTNSEFIYQSSDKTGDAQAVPVDIGSLVYWPYTQLVAYSVTGRLFGLI